MRNYMRAVVFCAVLVLHTSLAMADAEKCRMYDGYQDSGIGGTGYTQVPGGDDGIGGTGISAPGQTAAATPAVYVIGTIYARGSICVNGLRIEYADDMDVQGGIKAKDLAIGQLVEVEAEPVKGSLSLRAREIALVAPLEGPVTGIDEANKTIEVMGEKISVKGLPRLPAIAKGQRLRLSGLRNLSDEVVATSVESVGGVANAGEVEGDFTTAADGGHFIGKTPVVLAEGMAMPESGEEVTARGEWRENAFHVSSVSEHEDDGFTQGYLSIEGYIENVKGTGRARICDEEFNLERLKDVKFSEGDRVIVTATIDKTGALTAIGIKPIDLRKQGLIGAE